MARNNRPLPRNNAAKNYMPILFQNSLASRGASTSECTPWHGHADAEVFNQFCELVDYDLYATDAALRDAIAAASAGWATGSPPTTPTAAAGRYANRRRSECRGPLSKRATTCRCLQLVDHRGWTIAQLESSVARHHRPPLPVF